MGRAKVDYDTDMLIYGPVRGYMVMGRSVK